jgi:hypothetical protein
MITHRKNVAVHLALRPHVCRVVYGIAAFIFETYRISAGMFISEAFMK